MKLRQKMMLSFFTIISLLLMLVVGVLIGMNIIQSNAKKIYEDGLRPTSVLVSLEKLTHGTRVSMLQALLNGDITSTEQAENNLQQIRELIEQYAQFHMDEEQRLAMQEFSQAWGLFEDRVRQNIVLIKERKFEQANEGLMLGGPLFQKASEQLDILVSYNESSSEKLLMNSEDSFRLLFIILVIGSALSILLGIGISITFSRYLSNNIIRVTNRLKEIADGNLTVDDVTISNKRKDEIGQLAESTNEMKRKLYRLVSKMSDASQQVAASSEQLTASAQQSSTAVQQMAVMAQKTAEGAEEQSVNMNEVSSFMQQGVQHIQQIDASCENMLHRSQQAIERSVTGAQMADQVTGHMNHVTRTMDITSDSIASLAEKSGRISNIIRQITTIASQTNLLALNASIEAARAGEHGKGFGVVAQEIRNLAEQTRLSSEQTTAIILEIQRETQHVVESNRNATEAVHTGEQTIRQLTESFEDIRNSIRAVSTIIQEVVQAVRSLKEQSTQTLDSIETVHKISNDITAATQETSAASQEQLATIEEITASSEMLSSLAEDLQQMIEQFKI